MLTRPVQGQRGRNDPKSPTTRKCAHLGGGQEVTCVPRVAAGPADPVRLVDQGSPAALGGGRLRCGAEGEVCSAFSDVIASQCAVKFNTSRIY